jgi:hypothetical protein
MVLSHPRPSFAHPVYGVYGVYRAALAPARIPLSNATLELRWSVLIYYPSISQALTGLTQR